MHTGNKRYVIAWDDIVVVWLLIFVLWLDSDYSFIRPLAYKSSTPFCDIFSA